MEKYFFVNYKLDERATAHLAESLTEELFVSVQDSFVHVIFVPQIADLYRLSQKFSEASFFAPHVDSFPYGRGTGFILPESVQKNGAIGTILHHAEHKLSAEVLSATVKRVKEIGLKVMICVDSLEELSDVLALGPDFVAYEPPELIGGDISVSDAKPDVVKHFVDMVRSIRNVVPIIGAGVKTSNDIRASLDLGADGVFVASGVVRADNPGKVLKNLLEAYLS